MFRAWNTRRRGMFVFIFYAAYTVYLVTQSKMSLFCIKIVLFLKCRAYKKADVSKLNDISKEIG